MKPHAKNRLADRYIKVYYEGLLAIAKKCDVDTAVILGIGRHRGQSTGNYHDRKESNGDMTILIVRGKRPVTVMFRRSDQNPTAKAMRVDKLISKKEILENDSKIK